MTLIRIMLTLSCAAVPGGCATANQLAGSATYREKIVLPPEAEFSATLWETGPGGQRAIGRSAASAAGPPPYRFAIRYRRDAVSRDKSYLLRTAIAWRGEAYFTADEPLTGLPDGGAAPVTVIMRRTARPHGLTMPDGSVERPSGAPSPSADPAPSGSTPRAAALYDTDWQLVAIEGSAGRSADTRSPIISLARVGDYIRMSGRSGCNRIAGSATVDGGSIHFAPTVSTMTACVSAEDLRAAATGSSVASPVPGEESEADFITALRKATHYAISGRTLSLYSADESIVAKFEAK